MRLRFCVPVRGALRVLLLTSLLLGSGGWALAEEGGGDFDTRLRHAVAGLTAPDPDRRRQALVDLAPLVREDAGRCGRAVRGLGDVLRRREPEAAAAATLLLAALPGDKALGYWLRALDPEAHPAVFLAAVDGAAGHRDDPRGQKALLDRVRDEGSTPLRALALEALGELGGPAARLLLARPLDAPDVATEDWLLASARACGLARRGGEGVVAPLIALLAHPHAAVRVHAWEGLVSLTRQALPVDAAAWGAWHAQRERKPPEDASFPGTGEGDRYALPVPVHVPRYYGIPVDRPRSHVVFCLDISQSMYGRGIRQARDELTRTLLDFPRSYAFDIVAFNENVHPFAGELWPAHPVVKHRAVAWLEAQETLSYTNLYDAVETAFGYAGIGDRARRVPVARLDAVFLLSDGAPNRGRYRREAKVVEAIAALSGRRIPVHAVAAGEEVFPLLQQIAEATGGRFVDAFEFD